MASGGGMDLNFSFGGSSLPPRPEPESPFRIAVLADFSARASRGVADTNLASRRTLRVDIDNLDETIAACGVAVRIPAPGLAGTMDVRISRLDDFHPDHLYRTLPVFAPLRELRARLLDPATFAAAAEEARGLTGAAAVPAQAPAAPTAGAGSAAGGGLLESLLGGRPAVADAAAAAPPRPTSASVAAEFVKRLSQGSATAAPDPQRDALVAAVDGAIAARMRAVLHTPAFQRCEAAWRAAHFLITSIATDETLSIDLIDVSRTEIVADLRAAAAAGNLRGCSLGKLLAERSLSPGLEPWSLIVADLHFDFTTPDAALAAHIAAIAARAGAPVLASASPAHVGCSSFASAPDPETWALRSPAGDDAAPAAWAAVRQSPEAAYLCLTMPRFLLRAPYAPTGERVESFAFTELASPADHECCLWANAAYAAAVLIASAFGEDGADMVLPEAGDITGLPVHAYAAGGEKHVVPCAEAWLTLKASHVIQSAGLTPLLSIKGRDAARFATLQSFADPIGPLAGRWA